MSNQLGTKLRKELEEKNAKRSELLSKDALAAEELKELETLNSDCKSIVDQLTVINGAEADSKAQEELLKSAPTDSTFQHNGTTRAGETTIETEIKNGTKSVRLLDQTGEGLISEALAKKLSENSYLVSFRSYARKGLHGMDSFDRKNLEEGLDPQGGYFVPPEFLDRVVQRTMSPTRLQGRVTQLQTSRDRISMPRLKYVDGTNLDIYTTGFRNTWTGENPASSTQHRVNDSDLFGRTTIDVYTSMMSSVITKDMAEDSDFPVLSYVADKLSETVTIVRDQVIVQGTGVDQPSGILLNPGGQNMPRVILSGVANSLNADTIRGFPFDLPEQYINENTCWVMNRHNAGKFISLLKDAENRYMFARGSQDDKLANAHPDTLDGYPICYSAFMPNIGDGAFPIVFGDLSGYFMVNRVGLSVMFYHDSAYDQLNQIGIGARVRFGGKVVEEFKMNILKSDDA